MSKSINTRLQTKETMELVAMVIRQVFESVEFEAKLQSCLDRAFAKKMDELLERLETHAGKLHDIEVTMEKSSKDVQEITNKIRMLEEKCDRSLKEINELEQYSRRNCLRVFGIEDRPNENTSTIISEIASKYFGYTPSQKDIDRSHRVGQKEANKPRAILVKFSNYEARDRLIKNRRKLKGTKIVIREDLTKPNQDLLKATKNCPMVKSAWSHDGKIIALVNKNGSEFKKRIWGLNDLQRL
ncbi:hypothetical protein BSL78_02756 [Apostichopus japonicus]|uniref:Uncharacterized protein n=1 Tax=Stichopus japonicus TaxID=307972 RepID=A0A2G8LJB9_STIJA|nr:hypothetical protein BSL78_02756 [Apostichopus japonicus]